MAESKKRLTTRGVQKEFFINKMNVTQQLEPPAEAPHSDMYKNIQRTLCVSVCSNIYSCAALCDLKCMNTTNMCVEVIKVCNDYFVR